MRLGIVYMFLTAITTVGIIQDIRGEIYKQLTYKYWRGNGNIRICR